MCDYSLEMYRSRPAQAGEEYRTHRFPSGSVGFTAPADLTTAVCLSCDTRIRLENIPETVRTTHGVGPTADVVFARRETGPYRDAVRFANGALVSLQELGVGVTAQVIDTLSTPEETRKTVEMA